MKKLDVIVPCFNYARYLEECVGSILQQENVDVRITIIDDCSTDDTLRVAKSLASQDGRVVWRRHSVNIGNIRTYNEGIDLAKGDYFSIVSADDYLAPGALDRAVQLMEAHPELVFVHGGAIIQQEGQPKVEVPARQSANGHSISEGQAFIEAACRNSAGNPVWAPTAIIRTEVQKRIGGYDTQLPHAGDLEMWIRLASRGPVGELNSIQAIYRKHGSNMHINFQNISNLQQQRAAFESAFHKETGRIDNAEALRKVFMKGLAIGAVRSANHAINIGDTALFASCKDYAIHLFPAIRRTATWQEMCIRRLIGRKGVEMLRRFARPGL